jgi:hypothetical protein
MTSDEMGATAETMGYGSITQLDPAAAGSR